MDELNVGNVGGRRRDLLLRWEPAVHDQFVTFRVFLPPVRLPTFFGALGTEKRRLELRINLPFASMAQS